MKSLVCAVCMRISGVFIVSLFLLKCVSVYSQNDKKFVWDISGSLFNRVYQDYKEDNPYERPTAVDSRIKVNNRVVFNDWESFLFFNVEARTEGFFGEDTYEDVDLLLKDAYLQVRKQSFNFNVGRQTVNWGKLDDVVILDIVNPQDLTWFTLYEKNNRKDPVFMVKLDAFFESSQLEVAYVPVFSPSNVRFFGTDWSVFGHLKEAVATGGYSTAQRDVVRRISLVDQDEFTENVFDNGQVFIKFASTLGDVDASFYYMNKLSSVPVLSERSSNGNALKKYLYAPIISNLNALVNAALTDSDLTLERKYERMNVVGADFESVLGEFGLRGEAGAFLNQPYLRSDFSYVSKDALMFGVGLDHTTAQNIYMNIQVIENFVLDYEELFAQEESTFSVAGTLSKDFVRGKVLAEIDGACNLSQKDWMVNPVITYKFDKGLDVSLGGYIFEGNPSTVFGRFSTKDVVYLEAEYKF